MKLDSQWKLYCFDIYGPANTHAIPQYTAYTPKWHPTSCFQFDLYILKMKQFIAVLNLDNNGLKTQVTTLFKHTLSVRFE